MPGFVNILTTLRRGRAVEDYEARLHDLLAAVHKTGQKGEMSIKLVFEPSEGGMLHISEAITVKKPEKRGSTTFFWQSDREDDAEIGRNNPEQPLLAGFREVPGAPADAQDGYERTSHGG